MMLSNPKRHFIDTHCHIDDAVFDADREEILTGCRESGVDLIIDIAYREPLWNRAAALAAKHPLISIVVGLHPNHADEWSVLLEGHLRQAIADLNPVGVGETGLDAFRDHVSRDDQLQAFRGQMAIAADLNLPVVLHLRGEVEHDLLAVLTDFPGVHCVFHCFEGSSTLWSWLLERGHTIGVGGLITRPKSVDLRNLIGQTPIASIVLETDSPYLSPRGWKSRRNTPESIPRIARELADVTGFSLSQISESTTARAEMVFGLGDLR